jgi:hypothetical protein
VRIGPTFLGSAIKPEAVERVDLVSSATEV